MIFKGLGHLFLLFTLVLVSLSPFLWLSPFTRALDAVFHIRFAEDFTRCLFEGDGVPDWDARVFEGTGTPAFRFYAPLSYFICAIFIKGGLPPPISLKIVLFLFVTFGVFGTRRLFEALSLSSVASIGTFFFLAFPFIHIHLYLLFFFQNICSLMLFPWALAFWLESRQSRMAHLQLIIVFSCIGFTHLPTMLICGYAIFFLSMSEAIEDRKPQRVLSMLFLWVISLGIISPYLLPAIGTLNETHFAKISHVNPWEKNYFLDDWEMPIHPAGNPFGQFLIIRLMFLATMLLMVSLGTYGFFKATGDKSTENRHILRMTVVGFIFFFFNLRCSTEIWKILPGFMSFQYPWRFIFPGFLLLLPLLAKVFILWRDHPPRGLVRFLFLAGLGSLTLISFLSIFLSGNSPDLEQMRNILLAPTEYIPVACQAIHSVHHAGPVRQVTILSGQCQADAGVHRTQQSEWNFSGAASSSTIRINTHWDPYWRFSLDGKEQNLNRSGPCAVISVDIPQGLHQGVLHRVSPRYRNLGWGLSFLTVFAIYLWFRLEKHTRNHSNFISTEV